MTVNILQKVPVSKEKVGIKGRVHDLFAELPWHPFVSVSATSYSPFHSVSEVRLSRNEYNEAGSFWFKLPHSNLLVLLQAMELTSVCIEFYVKWVGLMAVFLEWFPIIYLVVFDNNRSSISSLQICTSPAPSRKPPALGLQSHPSWGRQDNVIPACFTNNPTAIFSCSCKH